MYLLKIIDNFYTHTLDGFIKRYRYEQGITGFLGLSFLSNIMSFVRNSILYSYNFITTSYPFKLAASGLSQLLEACGAILSYSFSSLSKVFGHFSDKAMVFAEGPLKTFAETKAIPALKSELEHIKEKPLTVCVGSAICLLSLQNIYNTTFNQDNSKKYTYPELAGLAVSSLIDCGIIYLSATALVTPKISVGSDKLTASIGLCFLTNLIFKRAISASASRS